MGNIIELHTSPTAINIEICSDFPSNHYPHLNSKPNKEMNRNMDPLHMMQNFCSYWQESVKYHNESVYVSGESVYFNELMVPMGDHLQMKLWFCIPI